MYIYIYIHIYVSSQEAGSPKWQKLVHQNGRSWFTKMAARSLRPNSQSKTSAEIWGFYTQPTLTYIYYVTDTQHINITKKCMMLTVCWHRIRAYYPVLFKPVTSICRCAYAKCLGCLILRVSYVVIIQGVEHQERMLFASSYCVCCCLFIVVILQFNYCLCSLLALVSLVMCCCCPLLFVCIS